MAEIKRIPLVWMHELAAGNILTGVEPNGVDSEEALFRGIYRRWTACTLAGLFQLPVGLRGGWRLQRVVWNLPVPGNVTINLIDNDGFIYQLNQVAAASGEYVSRESSGILVPPGWAIQVTSVNAIANAGRVVVHTGPGLYNDGFDMAPILGEEQYPPSKL
ncbi:MAG: hypothetical protein PHF64_06265 [Methanoregula sp.]|nr:hypothetical protein [Methanoregula sp.]